MRQARNIITPSTQEEGLCCRYNVQSVLAKDVHIGPGASFRFSGAARNQMDSGRGNLSICSFYALTVAYVYLADE